DVQIMSAGAGVHHSEYNASHFEPVNFLQIWIFPKQMNIRPRHEKRSFDPAGRINQWQVVVSAHPGDSGLYIYQDARLALTRLDAGRTLEYENAFKGNGVYVFVVTGQVAIGETVLSERDGLGISGSESFTVTAVTEAELLAIEVPMFG
ncbi:MAG TPA: pirin family protein, partial [Puia sp.]|nr:pirin family protein [Puia sp.]